MEAPGKRKMNLGGKGAVGITTNHRVVRAAHAGYTLSLVGILEGNPD